MRDYLPGTIVVLVQYRPPRKKNPHKKLLPKFSDDIRKSGAVVLKLVWNKPFLE